MLVQSYSDGSNPRLFIGDLVVDLSIPNYWLPGVNAMDRLKKIDMVIHGFSFYRREKWRKTDWGWEAKIRRRGK